MASPPSFPAADRYHDRALSLPLIPAMMDEQVEA
jgi:dTDP-4-amino-4,6-dideoxygalactose transaminase